MLGGVPIVHVHEPRKIIGQPVGERVDRLAKGLKIRGGVREIQTEEFQSSDKGVTEVAERGSKQVERLPDPFDDGLQEYAEHVAECA